MKKILLVAVIFSFVAIDAMAQRAERPGRKITPEKIAERAAERMANRLNLSEEQKEEVYTLHLERAVQNAEEMKARREKMQAEHQAMQEKLEAILTPEQKIQWEKNKTEARQKFRDARDGKRKFNGERRRGQRPGRGA